MRRSEEILEGIKYYGVEGGPNCVTGFIETDIVKVEPVPIVDETSMSPPIC